MSIVAMPAVDKQYILSLRHEIHEYPELEFDLPRTLAVVRRELESLGIPYTEQYGRSSIVGFLNPDCRDFTIGIRADMDALPLTEKTDLPFASKIPGIMHACGHDAHTAMLLGTAKALKSVEEQLTCRVLLVFQACEEGNLSGAREMVNDGLMDEIDVIIGMHIENWLEHGTVGVGEGACMAASHPLRIEFFGKTAHASLPQSGANALAMAVATYNGIQNMLATRIDPFAKYICCVGQLTAGHTDNVIPDYAQMKISLRSYDTALEQFIVDNICTIAENAAAAQGGSVQVHHEAKALPVVNHPGVRQAVLAAAEKVVGEENLAPMPIKMSSEDFSFFVAQKPGAFIRLGTRNAEKGCVTLPHNNDFLLDEEVLDIGSQVCVRFVLDNMGGMQL